MSDSEGNIIKNDSNDSNISKNTSSLEDLSEYTDADESISAPTEFLAEFLSALMLKDYKTALKYCKFILQYEPNNATAKEFFPLIVDKLELEHDYDDDDSASDESSSSCSLTESSNSDISTSESASASKSANCSGSDEYQKQITDSDATTASYSSLEEDEIDRDNNVVACGVKVTNTDSENGNIKLRHPQPPEKLSIFCSWFTEAHNHSTEYKKTGIACNSSNNNLQTAFSNDNVWNVSPDEQSSPVFPVVSSDSESPTDPSTQPSLTTINSVHQANTYQKFRDHV